jgi:signal transduction histidine kinase
VVYNLALNAVQAMPQGGDLRVVARNAHVRRPSPAGVVAGRVVRVSVTDTGPGIPSSVLAKIFEAHFTTKRQGMGIGLAASRALVIEAGGDITVESMGGVGTTFHAYVPAGVHTMPPPPLPFSREPPGRSAH